MIFVFGPVFALRSWGLVRPTVRELRSFHSRIINFIQQETVGFNPLDGISDLAYSIWFDFQLGIGATPRNFFFESAV